MESGAFENLQNGQDVRRIGYVFVGYCYEDSDAVKRITDALMRCGIVMKRVGDDMPSPSDRGRLIADAEALVVFSSRAAAA